MLFRPTFCANCGEKIDRAEWGIFTSRRFCQVCESEFKGQDLIPRFVVVAALLIGVLGVGGYLKSGTGSSETQLVRQPRKLAEQPLNSPAVSREVPASSPVNPTAIASPISVEQDQRAARKNEARMQEPMRPTKLQPEFVEEVYFCGAATAKGTPCKHRVKGKIRCFQHVGMPALLAAEQLRIK